MKKPLTTEGVIAAIKETNGNLAAVARRFGVSRQAVSSYCKAHVTCQTAHEEARETMKDSAESVLYRKILEGSTPELIFFLKTQCRDRGYIERGAIDLTITDKRPDQLDDDELEQLIADLKTHVR
jgi:hypothetical protein